MVRNSVSPCILRVCKHGYTYVMTVSPNSRTIPNFFKSPSSQMIQKCIDCSAPRPIFIAKSREVLRQDLSTKGIPAKYFPGLAIRKPSQNRPRELLICKNSMQDRWKVRNNNLGRHGNILCIMDFRGIGELLGGVHLIMRRILGVVRMRSCCLRS